MDIGQGCDPMFISVGQHSNWIHTFEHSSLYATWCFPKQAENKVAIIIIWFVISGDQAGLVIKPQKQKRSNA
jgi:hypothetical protein